MLGSKLGMLSHGLAGTFVHVFHVRVSVSHWAKTLSLYIAMGLGRAQPNLVKQCLLNAQCAGHSPFVVFFCLGRAIPTCKAGWAGSLFASGGSGNRTGR